MTEKLVERKDKMKLLALADIIVGERFRKDFGNMDDFVESIREKGIIQPISVDSNHNLLAGGRRYEGATRAGLKHIPAIIRPFTDEIDSREIELMENIHRKDFTWDEEARLIKEIDTLYKKTNREWSGRKTAELLDKSASNVSRNLMLANALEYFPELATNCTTADDALKLIKKMEADAISDELRDRQKVRMNEMLPPAPAGTKESPTAYLERGLKQMLHVADMNYKVGDTFRGMAELPSNGFIGFIECDPPYGIDLNSQKASKDSVTATVHGYEEVEADAYPEFLTKLATETYRIAGRDCWMVFWYGPTWHQQVYDALKAAGWGVDIIPAIWVKATGQTMQPEVNLARAYEPFFVCRKGKPLLNKRGRLNVFDFKGAASTGANAKIHPTERPVDLIEELLETFTVGQSNVFIPFLGSGNTLRACYNTGHKGWGYDLDGKYKDKFMLRVEADTKKNFADEAAAEKQEKDDITRNDETLNRLGL